LLLDSGSGWWRGSAVKELEEVTHTNGCLIWILEEHLNCRFKFSPPLLLDLEWRLRHLCKWSKKETESGRAGTRGGRATYYMCRRWSIRCSVVRPHLGSRSENWGGGGKPPSGSLGSGHARWGDGRKLIVTSIDTHRRRHHAALPQGREPVCHHVYLRDHW
jgi:hypothetical protein